MTDAPLSETRASSRSQSFLGQLWGQFRRHPGGVIGCIVFVAILLAVYVLPILHPVDPNKINILDRNKGPSFAHPFGTDNLGHDLFAQVMAGGQVSLAVGITAMLISLVLGTAVGVISGYYRRLDGVLMRITDLFLALPILPLLLVITMLFRDTLRSAFGPNTGIFLLIVTVIGITSWMHTARIVRSDVLSVKAQEFILAAKSSGMREYRIILRHILPNVLSSVMVSATLGIASAIITESALSFLGLGFPSDFPTWGRLLYDGVNFLQITPARAIWPGLMISLTVLSVNYIGDGLRDALDPRSLKR
ncbi:ABC transporter permease [Allorhizobium sp. BGMRC 0089]|uniref:ABC transporter permease n=1 Tax=Allorhizobium sonneratiae TaxID=2934936 RepID=UPI0020334B41|nr:ABC transporter permease [Allorhizobium sonneratiae]MCM2290758.1 ABC transporter permease [Allorhizobium sonneratiae]